LLFGTSIGDEIVRDTQSVGRENTAVVRAILGARERGDLSSLEWTDPEIEFVFADGPEPGSHLGRAAMEELFRSWLGAFADFRISAEDVIELDSERVLALTSVRGHGKTSGVDLARTPTKAAHLFELRAGKVSRMVVYFDRDRALAELAVGAPSKIAPRQRS
jgi:ketosteroid isomerase-like protein